MEISIATLKKVPALTDVPEQQLQWLIDHSSISNLSKGAYIFEKGDAIDKMYILLSGKAVIKVEQKGNFKQMGTIEAHSVSGFLPYSRATSALGYGELIEDGTLLVTPKDEIRKMASQHFELTEALVHVMTSRTRDFAKSNMQSEKMMALGKLSAGLAHELNNPVSSIARNAQELKKQLGNTPDKFKALMSIQATEQQVEEINKVLFGKINNRIEKNLGILERSELEDKVEQWLEEKGIQKPYELTETLIDFDLGIETLEEFYKITGPSIFIPTINWIENTLTTEKIVGEIQEASDRVANLILSVKGFTHMDQNPDPEPADMIKGLNNTLAILNYKLKTKGILVEKNFLENLPHPIIKIGEINQVWTNLIDNAIDAMEQGGKLGINVYTEGNCIFTEIIDNGEGISAENINSIFDPFFYNETSR